MKQISNIKHSWFNPLHKTVTRYNQEWSSISQDKIRFIGGTIRVYLFDRFNRYASIFIRDRMDSYVYSGAGEIEEIGYGRAPGRNTHGNTILATGDLTYLEVAGVVLVDKR